MHLRVRLSSWIVFVPAVVTAMSQRFCSSTGCVCWAVPVPTMSAKSATIRSMDEFEFGISQEEDLKTLKESVASIESILQSVFTAFQIKDVLFDQLEARIAKLEAFISKLPE
jgi:hypothetical protein